MIKIYNSESKQKEEFKPLIEGKIGMYVCGPTVYDVAHLGHGRSAVAFDVIRRYFEYMGYEVRFVSNYTDIDDKMINRAKDEGITVAELADKIIPEYEMDYGVLGVKKPTVQPKATEKKYIDGMIEIISKLEDGGYVYVIEGDGVYFDVSKYSDYGKFSGQVLEDLQAGSRVEVDERKRNPYDFALWKLKKEADEPSWESPWGDGRPGWHIECSSMSKEELGEIFDIHGGGLDLKFPHHECEVAQSRCAFGADTFARLWIHNGFIQVDNEKMSKSLGNFFTLKDIFKKYDPKVVRFMFLQTHYRNPINFSDQLLEQAKSGLARIHAFVRRLESEVEVDSGQSEDIYPFDVMFEQAMDADFDTSGALGAVFELIKITNAALDAGKNIDCKKILADLAKIDDVLGVIFSFQSVSIDSEVEGLIKEREEARAARDFLRSDQIRDELKAKGIELEDTANGTIWKKV